MPGGGFPPVYLPFANCALVIRHLLVVEVPPQDDVICFEVGLIDATPELGSAVGGARGIYINNYERSTIGGLEGDVLRAPFNQYFVRHDEGGGCLVDQNGHAGVGSLQASHRDALIPEGTALPKLDALDGIPDVLPPEMMLLNEHDLGRGLE